MNHWELFFFFFKEKGTQYRAKSLAKATLCFKEQSEETSVCVCVKNTGRIRHCLWPKNTRSVDQDLTGAARWSRASNQWVPLFLFPFNAWHCMTDLEAFICQVIKAEDWRVPTSTVEQRSDRGSSVLGPLCWTISSEINLVLCFGSLGAARHLLLRKCAKAADSSAVSWCKWAAC